MEPVITSFEFNPLGGWVLFLLTVVKPIPLFMLVMWIFSVDAIHRKQVLKGLMWLALCFLLSTVRIFYFLWNLWRDLYTTGMGREESIVQGLWLLAAHVVFTGVLVFLGLGWFSARNETHSSRTLSWLVSGGILIVLAGLILLFLKG